MPESEPPKTTRAVNLPNLGLSVRILFTSYLGVVAVGLAMAGTQILLTHGMADGEPGLSINDIVYSYYGNRGGTRLEVKLQTTMRDKAPTDARYELVRWVQNGATEEEWDTTIQPIVQQYCVRCHGGIQGLTAFTSYEAMLPLAQTDPGASVDSLTRVSHIHLFGIAFIFFFVGGIFSLAVGIPKWLKNVAIATPFVFLLIDILSWWLTKWYPDFAVLTIVGGFGYNLASVFMLGASLYQMWILPRKGKVFDESPWA